MDLLETRPGDDLFPAWCEVWSQSGLAERPEQPPRPSQEHVALGEQLLAAGGSREGTHRAAVHDGRVVGALRLVLPVKDNVEMASVDLAVHPGARRQGVGTLLHQEALRLAAASGRTRLITEVDEPDDAAPGRAFALRHAWSCDLVETRRDLVLPVDERRLAAVEAEARAHSAGYELVTWRDRIPDPLVDDRALLERRMTTDAPHGDLPVEEEHWDAERVREYEAMYAARRRALLSAGAVKDGRLVAFTDLQVPLDAPEHAYQAGTLVLREHRGHRLGALVKTAVLRDLARDLPQVRRITTVNEEGNAPMVAVNEALGFVAAGRLSSWSRRV
jgi:GNAT superfamily N-acetyltransferase